MAMPGSLYLRSTHNRGFGVFVGSPTVLQTTPIASYGGAVMTYSKVNDRRQIYGLFGIKLHKTKARDDDLEAVVDGTSMWAGDGKFINHSCFPNIEPYSFLDNLSPLDVDSSQSKGVTDKLKSRSRNILCFHYKYVLMTL